MKTWKQWGTVVFLVAGLACGGTEFFPDECASAEDGTPCNGGKGTCQSNTCQPVTVPKTCGVSQTQCGTQCCDDASEVCDAGKSCQPKPLANCTAAQTECGTQCCDNATQVCNVDVCEPKPSKCQGGQTECGSNCCNATEVCNVGTCEPIVLPCQVSTLSLNVAPGAALSPIDRTTTFSVAVSCFKNTADADKISLSVGTVPAGLEAPKNISNSGSTTRSFIVTVTYDGTTEFPTGLATVPFELKGLPNGYVLDNPAPSATLTIRDGRAKTAERVIWVNQANIEAFNSYAEATAEGRSRHYRMTGDVALSAPVPPRQSNWDLIGLDSGRPFTGSFDGGGNTLDGLTLVAANLDYQGMFGYVAAGAVIENLGLTNLSVAGRDHVGALVGANFGTVRNCHAQGEVRGGSNVGGLVGLNNNTVNSSHAKVNVSGTSDNVGGLVGRNYRVTAGTAIVQDSYATGNVSGVRYVGGLVGDNYCSGASAKSTVQASHATGKVTGTGSYVGGLVGQNHSSTYTSTTVVQNSYATGDVTGSSDYVGGLVGYNYKSGSNTILTVENSYATGEVNGSRYVGGLVGYSSNSTVQYSMALNPKVSGTASVGRVAGYSSSSLSYNYAFEGMLNSEDKPDWSKIGHNAIDGESRSKGELQTRAGFPTPLLDPPWVYQPGRLPGLLGQTVAMPLHLQ